MFSTPKFVRIYVFFKKIMGSTRSHPLPPGIFVEMPTTPNEFENCSTQDLEHEINRLKERLREIDETKKQRGMRIDYETVVLSGDDYEYDSDDSDDVMHDPDVRKMVENGEHICHMFDGECRACTMEEEEEDEDEDEDEDEVRVLTEEEVQNDPEMTAHFC
jgi:hypothetical protein